MASLGSLNLRSWCARNGFNSVGAFAQAVSQCTDRTAPSIAAALSSIVNGRVGLSANLRNDIKRLLSEKEIPSVEADALFALLMSVSEPDALSDDPGSYADSPKSNRKGGKKWSGNRANYDSELKWLLFGCPVPEFYFNLHIGSWGGVDEGLRARLVPLEKGEDVRSRWERYFERLIASKDIVRSQAEEALAFFDDERCALYELPRLQATEAERIGWLERGEQPESIFGPRTFYLLADAPEG